MDSWPRWLQELVPILLLLAAVAVVLLRLPRVDLGHSDAFRRRRVLNWLPLGLTYAFLYMGRYNLTVAANAIHGFTKKDFSDVFFWGTLVYGVAFLVNGPLTDRWGGRRTILISAVGSALANLAMGWMLSAALGTGATLDDEERAALVRGFALLYSANMYFQSFGAVSIVKVNAHWFHVRERGVFGGIFGILISLGIYFAYDWGALITRELPVPWVFWIPAGILFLFVLLDTRYVFDHPHETGHADIESGEDALTEHGEQLTLWQVGKRLFSSPVLVTIAGIEFCSGFLRQAIMQYYPFYAKQTGQGVSLIDGHWGMFLCIAGILGGVFAGVISDRLFHSRRGPVAGLLYGGMLAGAIVVWVAIGTPTLAWTVIGMSLCVIGVHGMLSGTASMDFAGKRNAGIAVGIIDGFVYLGTAAQALVLGIVLPSENVLGADGRPLSADVANWWTWPVAMVPLALVGLVLALRLWNARPRKAGGH